MKTLPAIIAASSLAISPLVWGTPVFAQEVQQLAPSAELQIDYEAFQIITAEVAALRAERLLPKAEFFAGASENGALLLDTRSAAAFAAGHIDGAVNLPFSDFTESKLRDVIGADTDRPIYIYCNNNFTDDVAPVRAKLAPLALNIPTFINLVGYGYANVWELGETMPLAEVNWVSAEPPEQ